MNSNDESPKCREAERKPMDPFLTVTLCTVLIYLILGSSEEFAAFTPVATGPVALYAVALVFGSTTGWFAVSLGEGTLRLAVLIIIPCLVYGVARVWLPVYVLNGSELINVLSFMAFQRVTLYFLALSVMGSAGMVLGMMLRTWI